MRVKKFLARTLADAVAQVRAELGPEAIILQTQPVKVGGIFGFFSQKMIEVTAAADPAFRPRPPAPPPAPEAGSSGAAGAAAGAAEAAGATGATAAAAAMRQAAPTAGTATVATTPGAGAAQGPVSPAAPEGELAELRAQVDRMGGILTRVLERLETPVNEQLTPELQPIFGVLVRNGVDPGLAGSLCRRMQTRLKKEPQATAAQVAEEVLIKQLGAPVTIQAAPGSRRVVALLGPTGVGKTTTLAKLASFWALRRGLNVALITADTYRIAAVEQLRTYCEIIGVPLEVVERPEEVPAALDRYRQADLILVDTAGRSHRNPEQMQELAAYVKTLAPDEIYLVISLTASQRDAIAVVDSYTPIGFHKLLFTKLDEAAAPGILLNALVHAGRPLSYITTGQNVPDDIEVAAPERLSRLLLGDWA